MSCKFMINPFSAEPFVINCLCGWQGVDGVYTLQWPARIRAHSTERVNLDFLVHNLYIMKLAHLWVLQYHSLNWNAETNIFYFV